MESDRQTVLIVDDVPTNIRMLQALLKDQYRILFAVNGAKALELAVDQQPDLVLLDVMMPEMDGYEVCQRLKAMPDTAEIPVIFVSALGDEEEEAQGLEAGAIDYITKPVSPSIVRARVRNHLELKHRGDLLRASALRDPLTGIPNHQRFEEALETEWRRCLRNNEPLSVVLMDIDYFMAYNEHYGHARGDRCLIEVARLLGNELKRPGDLLARFGGDQFAALLPEIDREGASVIAERIREVAHAARLEHDASPTTDRCITLSAGVFALEPQDDNDVDGLMAEVEKDLLRAKRNRNIV